MKVGIILAAAALAVAVWQALASLLFLAALGFWSVYPWPDRLWMWACYALEAPPNVIVHRWLTITAVLPVLLPVLITVLFVTGRRRGSRQKVYGESQWAGHRDMVSGGISSDRVPF